VLYVAEAYENTARPGVPVAIPADGSGPAIPVLDGPLTLPWILAPKVGPGGELVYVEPWDYRPGGVCWEIPAVIAYAPEPLLPIVPIFIELRYRTRPVGSSRDLGADPVLRVELPGYSFSMLPGAPPREFLDVHPR
jgi:hypothetical protein